MKIIENWFQENIYVWTTYVVSDFAQLHKSLETCKEEFTAKYNIEKWGDTWSIYDKSRDVTLGATELLNHIQDKMLDADDSGRKYILKQAARWLRTIMSEQDKEDNAFRSRELASDDNPLNEFIAHVYTTLLMVSGKICRIASDMNYDMNAIAGYKIDEDLLSAKEPERERKYNYLERTVAIEAVKQLLQKLGVNKTTDRTKIAGFVEAVTGGNTGVRPADTLSYKPAKPKAKETAAELLKNIGL